MPAIQNKLIRHTAFLAALSVTVSLALAGCSAPAPPLQDPESPQSSTATGPVGEAPESNPDLQKRVLYAIASDAGAWGVYSSNNGIDWEFVTSIPEDFSSRATIGGGTSADVVVYHDGRDVLVMSAASGWDSIAKSSYTYRSSSWDVKPRAYADGAWWSMEAGGLWTSADGVSWENAYDQVDEFQNFRDGVAATDALPNGDLHGNGELLLLPKTAQRGGTSLLRPVALWDEVTLPVWVSSDGQEWERRETQISGSAPGEVAGDLRRDHYVWDGARWLWQADDSLFAAAETGGTLVFEKVSDIGADGETPRGEIAAAGDLLVVPATNANPKSNDSGTIVGGTVLLSTDGGRSWQLHETAVYLGTIMAIIDG